MEVTNYRLHIQLFCRSVFAIRTCYFKSVPRSSVLNLKCRRIELYVCVCVLCSLYLYDVRIDITSCPHSFNVQPDNGEQCSLNPPTNTWCVHCSLRHSLTE